MSSAAAAAASACAARRFFGAKRLDARGLETGRLRGERFLLRRELGRGLRGCRSGRRLLLGGGLHVGRLSATTNRIGGRRHRLEALAPERRRSDDDARSARARPASPRERASHAPSERECERPGRR